MYKNATFKEKFDILKKFQPIIIEDVKKDLKNDHLKKDIVFFKKYFAGKNVNKLTGIELAEAYNKAMHQEESAEEIAEFIASRWVIKFGELYEFFSERLREIHPNFTDLETLTEAESRPLLESAIEEFGPVDTYLFSVINSVVFPKEIFEELEQAAVEEFEGDGDDEEDEDDEDEDLDLDVLGEAFSKEIENLEQRYEKKLSGLEKKYIADTEALKKQIAALQRKLAGKA